MLKRLVRSHSQALSTTFSSMRSTRNERHLSSGSSYIDQPSVAKHGQAQDAASFNPSDKDHKILVLGGNGYVGSHICKEALKQGLTVSSLSRSGRPSLDDAWVNDVIWHQGDLLSPDSLKPALDGVISVISCVGGFGSNTHMFKINGTANINAVKAAAEQGVQRFVYISAADFGFINFLLRGYYDGKRATEAEIEDKFASGGTILRPGFIHGTRRAGSINIPLSLIGAPLELVLKNAKLLTKIPLIGPLLIPPVHVESVAKVAVQAAAGHKFSPGLLDVYDILRHCQMKSA